MIGLLTAVIGDVASQFGCVVDLNDAVTAVTLVAMGTSVPGECFQEQHRLSTRVCRSNL